MNNIRILVATHKKFQMPDNELYLAIHVGKKGKESLGYIGDDTGENISYKNSNYCELTALYWYLKNCINDSIDYIGLNHYRRYFIFDNGYYENNSIIKMNFESWKKINQNNDEFLYEITENTDVILPKKRVYPISIKSQYSTMHIKYHLEEVVRIIKEYYPEYLNDTNAYLNQNKSYLYNMFIMKKDYFIEMMEWIFDVLFKLEERIDIPEDKQQARVFGFLSERLINIYVLKKKLKIKELPVAFINDEYRINKDNYKMSMFINNNIFILGRKLWDYLLYDKEIKIIKSRSKK